VLVPANDPEHSHAAAQRTQVAGHIGGTACPDPLTYLAQHDDRSFTRQPRGFTVDIVIGEEVAHDGDMELGEVSKTRCLMGGSGSVVSGNGHRPKPTRPDALDVRSKIAADVPPGETPAGSDIVLVKQQGAMRTGTNLVKFALEENFTNVRVLVNIGRWKHATADTPFTWHGENWEVPGRTLDVATRIDPVELRTVRTAVDTGMMRYAISVRNVYSWLVSYLRFAHWYDDPPLGELSELGDDEIIAAVQQWNVLYRSYRELLADERRCMLFRLEDLHTAFEVTLERSRQQWNLRRRHRRYIRPERYLRAGIDGQSRSQLLESSLFDRTSQLADARLGELHGSVLDLVRETVDEDVVRAYGYEVR
jgi:hypothetical protein